MKKTRSRKKKSKFKKVLKKVFKRLRKILFVLGILLVVILLLIIFFAGRLISAFPLVSDFLNREKRVLVVFQNEAEIRATGGFISSYAVVESKNAFLQSFDLKDSYDFPKTEEKVPPPEVLGKMLETSDLKFRDLNYQANFADSAREILSFFYRHFPQKKLDAVVAVNFSVVENLLEEIGGISHEGEKISLDKIFSYLEFLLQNVDHHNWEQLQKRKEVIKEFAKKIIKKSLLNPFKYRSISNILAKSLDEKEIQIYFTDSRKQELVENKGWSGSFTGKQERDFLGIVASNYGGGKSNRYVKRNIKYALEPINERDIHASLKISLDHLGLFNEPISTRYKEYLKVFVPESTVLRSINVNPESARCPHMKENFVEGNFRVFDACIEMNPGEKVEINFVYNLPHAILSNGNYSIFIPKQSGTKNHLDLVFRLPNQGVVSSENFHTYENIATFSGIQNKNLSLELKIDPDRTPPRAMYQRFVSLGEIEFRVNEKLKPETVTDITNFSLIDTNKRLFHKTDYPEVKDAKYEFPFVRIFLKGVSPQNEEIYRLEMSNIEDLSSNLFTPNPKSITFIQRNLEEKNETPEEGLDGEKVN